MLKKKVQATLAILTLVSCVGAGMGATLTEAADKPTPAAVQMRKDARADMQSRKTQDKGQIKNDKFDLKEKQRKENEQFKQRYEEKEKGTVSKEQKKEIWQGRVLSNVLIGQ